MLYTCNIMLEIYNKKLCLDNNKLDVTNISKGGKK